MVGLDDQFPKLALAQSVGERQPQQQALEQSRTRVFANMNPLCAPNELGHVATLPSQRFGDLDAARAPTDHAPSLAGVGNAVIPARRMKSGACKTVTPGDIWIERFVEKAGRGDEDSGDKGLDFCRSPVLTVFGEAGFNNFLFEPNEPT